ncbi:hypothetical protein MHYP_G00052350 [Metynnis hypsauchen]
MTSEGVHLYQGLCEQLRSRRSCERNARNTLAAAAWRDDDSSARTARQPSSNFRAGFRVTMSVCVSRRHLLIHKP